MDDNTLDIILSKIEKIFKILKQHQSALETIADTHKKHNEALKILSLLTEERDNQ